MQLLTIVLDTHTLRFMADSALGQTLLALIQLKSFGSRDGSTLPRLYQIATDWYRVHINGAQVRFSLFFIDSVLTLSDPHDAHKGATQLSRPQ